MELLRESKREGTHPVPQTLRAVLIVALIVWNIVLLVDHPVIWQQSLVRYIVTGI